MVDETEKDTTQEQRLTKAAAEHIAYILGNSASKEQFNTYVKALTYYSDENYKSVSKPTTSEIRNAFANRFDSEEDARKLTEHYNEQNYELSLTELEWFIAENNLASNVALDTFVNTLNFAKKDIEQNILKDDIFVDPSSSKYEASLLKQEDVNALLKAARQEGIEYLITQKTSLSKDLLQKNEAADIVPVLDSSIITMMNIPKDGIVFDNLVIKIKQLQDAGEIDEKRFSICKDQLREYAQENFDIDNAIITQQQFNDLKLQLSPEKQEKEGLNAITDKGINYSNLISKITEAIKAEDPSQASQDPINDAIDLVQNSIKNKQAELVTAILETKDPIPEELVEDINNEPPVIETTSPEAQPMPTPDGTTATGSDIKRHPVDDQSTTKTDTVAAADGTIHIKETITDGDNEEDNSKVYTREYSYKRNDPKKAFNAFNAAEMVAVALDHDNNINIKSAKPEHRKMLASAVHRHNEKLKADFLKNNPEGDVSKLELATLTDANGPVSLNDPENTAYVDEIDKLAATEYADYLKAKANVNTKDDAQQPQNTEGTTDDVATTPEQQEQDTTTKPQDPVAEKKTMTSDQFYEGIQASGVMPLSKEKWSLKKKLLAGTAFAAIALAGAGMYNNKADVAKMIDSAKDTKAYKYVIGDESQSLSIKQLNDGMKATSSDLKEVNTQLKNTDLTAVERLMLEDKKDKLEDKMDDFEDSMDDKQDELKKYAVSIKFDKANNIDEHKAFNDTKILDGKIKDLKKSQENLYSKLQRNQELKVTLEKKIPNAETLKYLNKVESTREGLNEKIAENIETLAELEDYREELAKVTSFAQTKAENPNEYRTAMEERLSNSQKINPEPTGKLTAMEERVSKNQKIRSGETEEQKVQVEKKAEKKAKSEKIKKLNKKLKKEKAKPTKAKIAKKVKKNAELAQSHFVQKIKTISAKDSLDKNIAQLENKKAELNTTIQKIKLSMSGKKSNTSIVKNMIKAQTSTQRNMVEQINKVVADVAFADLLLKNKTEKPQTEGHTLKTVSAKIEKLQKTLDKAQSSSQRIKAKNYLDGIFKNPKPVQKQISDKFLKAETKLQKQLEILKKAETELKAKKEKENLNKERKRIKTAPLKKEINHTKAEVALARDALLETFNTYGITRNIDDTTQKLDGRLFCDDISNIKKDKDGNIIEADIEISLRDIEDVKKRNPNSIKGIFTDKSAKVSSTPYTFSAKLSGENSKTKKPILIITPDWNLGR